MIERNHRILLVEDNQQIRRLVRLMLEALPVEVSEASNVREAMAAFLRDQPRMVFLDVMLPDGDGLSLCHNMKAVDSTAYIVMVSARGQAHDIERARSVGANGYIVKPFEPEQLLEQAYLAMPELVAGG